MHSFTSFLQNLEENHESGSMKAIRNGLGIDKNFWDNFLLLLNNPEAVSDLLDVPLEKVGNWYDSIKNSLDKVKDSDREVIPKDKNKVLKTGLPEEI